MPIWPFKKRRRSVNKDEASQPLTEKAQPARAATPTSPIPIPRKSSKRGTLRKRQPSQADEAADTAWAGSEKPPTSADKENVPPSHARTTSREDITALPMSRKLESSPHLRPVDLEKPPIPYNFRTYSGSQSSLQREATSMSSPPRAGTLRSRRSGYDSVPSRMSSAKRKKDDQLREEEIRAMSAQMPMPKRPGEGPLRRDSKKLRGAKDSTVSLPPPEDSIISMSAILEQRGWEIGSIDVFNPRPAVRLSGTPQYVTPGSTLSMQSPSSPESMKKEKEKVPTSRGSARKRETIGNRVDDLDATDIRLLLERDAKRREKRRKDQQEKLDKKLRSRGGRNRGDSDRRRREAEEVRRAEEAKQRAEQENEARDLAAAPTAIHPALRDAPDPQSIGLGIGEDQAAPGAPEAEDHPFRTPLVTPTEKPVDPFADPVVHGEEDTVPILKQEEPPRQSTTASQDVQMQDTSIETAREVPMSQVSTPPLSPISATRTPTQLSQVMDSRRLSDLPTPARILDDRRVSDPKPERRAGAWATFFRRGGTKLQRGDDGTSPTSEKGFSNTSRESMRNQPLPPHLIDTAASQTRRKSGTPVRTQSKFREDLPEMPISPPDSRLSSPDITTAAAAAAAARRAARSSAQAQDVAINESEAQPSTRNDTPVTPSQHRITSMASIDSEGSWLASGSAKRTSTQSALAQRRTEFTGSYEELGGDKDAEYVNRPTSGRKISSPALAGRDPAEESGEDEARAENSDPMTMHESVRRHPTLVHRDPRVKSREGLLTEYSAGGGDTPIPTSAGTGRGSLDFDSDEPEPEIQRASSVGYGKGTKGHARQISAGSAKLYDVGPRSPTSQPTTTEE